MCIAAELVTYQKEARMAPQEMRLYPNSHKNTICWGYYLFDTQAPFFYNPSMEKEILLFPDLVE